MRLINIETRELEEFSEPPKHYAILSHTWGSEEVSYQEYLNGEARHKAGYDKINAFCEKAEADGWPYGWVDTCCIDKSSSAELSEAINSMFRWYQLSSVCFAYLGDVKHGLGDEEFLHSFRRSHWFSRGWTLQELLAPRHVTFLNQDWDDIGTRDMLESVIEETTGIFSLTRYEQASVAQIFSWAARRRTTRAEDRAYSLLGLVGVNMPLLYGEREESFARLQAEILARGHDDSIFTWSCDSVAPPDGYDDHPWHCSRLSTMLAASLDQFADCQHIYPHKNIGTPSTSTGLWTITNLGLSGTFTTAVTQEDTDSTQLMVTLSCTRDQNTKVHIMLTTLPSKSCAKTLGSSPQSLVCLRREGEIMVGEPQTQPVSKTATLCILQPPRGIMLHRAKGPEPVLRLDQRTLDQHAISLQYHLAKGPQLATIPSRSSNGAPLCPGTKNTILLSEAGFQTEFHMKEPPIVFQDQDLVDLRRKSFTDHWNTGSSLEGREIYAFKVATGETFLLITYMHRYAKLLFMNLLTGLDRIHECSQNFDTIITRHGNNTTGTPSTIQQESFYFLFMETRNHGVRWTSEVSLEIRPGLWIQAINRPALSTDGRLLRRITLQASTTSRGHPNLIPNHSGIKRALDTTTSSSSSTDSSLSNSNGNGNSVEEPLSSSPFSSSPSRKKGRRPPAERNSQESTTTNSSVTSADTLSQRDRFYDHLYSNNSGVSSSDTDSRRKKRGSVIRQASRW